MIKHTIPLNLPVTMPTNFKNFVVGGNSFSHNPSSEHSLIWAAYLRERMGIENYYDTTCGGTGNFFIMSAVIYALEKLQPDPEETFVAIMWSGNDRDDMIINGNYSTIPHLHYEFTDNVAVAISGGMHDSSVPNVNNFNVNWLKSLESRTIENYVYISSLYHYLKSNNYNFLFLDYMSPDRKFPHRSSDFGIVNLLPKSLADNLKQMMRYDIPDIYSWCLKRNLLSDDNYHPSVEGNFRWTNEVLVPHLNSHPDSVQN